MALHSPAARVSALKLKSHTDQSGFIVSDCGETERHGERQAMYPDLECHCSVKISGVRSVRDYPLMYADRAPLTPRL